jgi:hypothetical protein
MAIYQVISAIACVVFDAIRFIIIQLVAVVGWLALMKVLLAMVWVLLKSLVSTIHAMLLFMKQNEQPQSAAAAAFPIVFRDNDASGYKSSIASPAPPTSGTTDWPRRTTKTNDQAAPGNTPELQPTRPNKSYTSPPDSASMIASLATAISCCDRKSSAYFSEVETVVPSLQQKRRSSNTSCLRKPTRSGLWLPILTPTVFLASDVLVHAVVTVLKKKRRLAHASTEKPYRRTRRARC